MVNMEILKVEFEKRARVCLTGKPLINHVAHDEHILSHGQSIYHHIDKIEYKKWFLFLDAKEVEKMLKFLLCQVEKKKMSKFFSFRFKDKEGKKKEKSCDFHGN